MNKLKSKGDKGSPFFTPELTKVNRQFNLIHDLDSLYRPRLLPSNTQKQLVK